jgi:hypothetical protein
LLIIYPKVHNEWSKGNRMAMTHHAIVLSILGIAAPSNSVLVNMTWEQQADIDCQLWQAKIKPGQPLTDELRQGARVIPPNGVVTLEYRAGRRTIWMGNGNKIKRATCG